MFKFWNTVLGTHGSVQDWEVKVRQTGSLCEYEALNDVMCRDKFVFGLHQEILRSELLKTHLKPDNKSMFDVVSEANTLESAQQANKLIGDASKHIEEHVDWTMASHRQMKLKREPGTCHWCGETRGSHAWIMCPAHGQTCAKCGGNDHFAKVCCMKSQRPDQR
jgi:hypothetical protein